MNILAIDTTYGCCAVTLKFKDSYFSVTLPGLHQQTESLLPCVHQVLDQSGLSLSALDGLAFSAGPASFTGIRLALSAVQGIALAANLSIVAVNSLHALAQAFYALHHHQKILTCTNAYMGQLFWAGFSLDQQQKLHMCYPQKLMTPEELPSIQGEDWVKIGNGWKICQLDTVYHDFVPPSATAVADLAVLAFQAGQAHAAAMVTPVYLRTAAAWKKLS